MCVTWTKKIHVYVSICIFGEMVLTAEHETHGEESDPDLVKITNDFLLASVRTVIHFITTS